MIFHQKELNATMVDWFFKHSVFVSKILTITWAFKSKHLIFAIIFLCEIFFTEISKPQNLLFLGRRVSLFRELWFMLKLLCNCSCRCNICSTFVILLNAENVVPQENLTLMNTKTKFCWNYVIFCWCDLLFFIFARIWSYGTCSRNFIQQEF